MLARIAAALLAITTCQREEPRACRVSEFACYPVDPLADGTCAHACGQAAHCQDYARDEYAFCKSHPGVPRASTKRCALDGFPNWISHCTPGPPPPFTLRP